MDESVAVDGPWGRLGRLLLPPRCLLCGARGHGGLDLCAACRGDLPRNALCCARCAAPLRAAAAACGDCLRRPPPIAAAVVPFRYGWPLDRLITGFKFAAGLAAGRVLAALLAEAVEGTAPPVDALVPVPLHRDRLAERGYNQALELARPLARALRLPLAPALLLRQRATAAQSGLDRASRRRNVRDAFVAPRPLAGAHLALIDDVVTTGATAAAAAAALRQAGAARVQLWAVARAGR